MYTGEVAIKDIPEDFVTIGTLVVDDNYKDKDTVRTQYTVAVSPRVFDEHTSSIKRRDLELWIRTNINTAGLHVPKDTCSLIESRMRRINYSRKLRKSIYN